MAYYKSYILILFPLTDTFWSICSSRLLKKKSGKSRNKFTFIYKRFVPRHFQSFLLQICCIRGVSQKFLDFSHKFCFNRYNYLLLKLNSLWSSWNEINVKLVHLHSYYTYNTSLWKPSKVHSAHTNFMLLITSNVFS